MYPGRPMASLRGEEEVVVEVGWVASDLGLLPADTDGPGLPWEGDKGRISENISDVRYGSIGRREEKVVLSPIVGNC